jgi:hypothetical protein
MRKCDYLQAYLGISEAGLYARRPEDWSDHPRPEVQMDQIEIEVSWYYMRKKYINDIIRSALWVSFLSWNCQTSLRVLNHIIRWYRLYLLQTNHLFYHPVISIMFGSVKFLGQLLCTMCSGNLLVAYTHPNNMILNIVLRTLLAS